ncbi:MAG: hypothetical protein K9N06_11025 [Candidatus Cloacimonetes bacterium]|nr:hypothetical protein [Candidatus Cloacimonadota bacterium]
MKKRLVIVILLVLCGLVILSCGKKISFDHYGVYVKGNDGFHEILNNYENSNVILHNDTSTQIQYKTALEIYVYSPQSKTHDYKLFVPFFLPDADDVDLFDILENEDFIEVKLTVSPLEKQNDIVKLTANITSYSGPLILFTTKENRGYLFNSKNLLSDELEKDETTKLIEEITNSYRMTQSIQNSRQSIISDLQTYGAQVMQYYRTPLNQGGGGSSISKGDESKIASYIGWEDSSTITDNGTFSLSIIRSNSVQIVGVGTVIGNDGNNNVSATITVSCTSRSPLSTKVNN